MAKKQTTTALAKPVKAAKVKLIQATSPALQLQMLFSEIEKDQQKERELKATLKEARESHKKYGEAKELKSKYETLMHDIKSSVDSNHSEEIAELDEIKERKDSRRQEMESKAIALLSAGERVSVRGEDGREHELRLAVKVVSSAFQAESREDDEL